MVIITVGTLSPRADFLDFNLKYLRFVGLWPDKNWSFIIQWLYKSYEITLLFFSLVFLIITGIGAYTNKDELIIILTNMDKTIVAYNYVFKIIIFFAKRKQIRILITEILFAGDTVTEEKKKLMAIHVVAVSVMVTTITGGFQILAYHKGEMVVDAWFPFDPMKNKTTLFLSGQTLVVLFAVPCIFRAISIQGIVCSIIMYMCDQLIDLQMRLKALFYSVENEAYIREEFKNIIKMHIRLLGYSKSIKETFQEYFLIQNLAVTAELCLNALMVSIVGLDQKNRLITFMAFLMVALFNAYIFCYLGNELMDQSVGISLAAYESSWTSWPVDMQSDLLVVITAAQRSFKLSAGGMAYMSMQTFAQALYNGYSMFAVLRDMVN